MTEVRLILDLHEELSENTATESQRLDAQERERAGRFVFARDRRQFVRAHSLLRTTLGEVLGVPPGEVSQERDPCGKPVLAGPAAARCQFNMSHCTGAILIGIASSSIGVDIESIRGRPFPFEVCSTVFTSAERSGFDDGTEEALTRACYAHWTRKEAVLKAEGCGLSLEPSTFEIAPVGQPPMAGEASRDTWTARIRDTTYHGVTSVLDAGWVLSVACADADQRAQAMAALDRLLPPSCIAAA